MGPQMFRAAKHSVGLSKCPRSHEKSLSLGEFEQICKGVNDEVGSCTKELPEKPDFHFLTSVNKQGIPATQIVDIIRLFRHFLNDQCAAH